MMSFSCATSHLNAAPPTEAATPRALAMSRSATITLAAPAWWKASHNARPMPLPPPVTTTILPLTCMANPGWWRWALGQYQIEHGGVMTRRAEKHETMPDRVLETKLSPCVEDYPETVEQSTGHDEPECQLGQRGKAGVIGDDAAPAHRKVEADRHPIEASGKKQLQHDADRRDTPHARQQRHREHAVLQLRENR